MAWNKISKFQNSIKVLDKNTTPIQVLEEIANSGINDEAFYVMDVDDIRNKFINWNHFLPNIKTYYAVKCNDSQFVLEVLAALGTGFDCASKVEMERILALGVSPDRVIFAHPTKIISHIRFAGENGIKMMTFDSLRELDKIKQNHPNPKLILRLRVEDRASAFPLGAKFGCQPQEVSALLRRALELELPVYGVSFHVGSECSDNMAFPNAVDLALEAIERGRAMGIKTMNILDLGGGFPGETDTSIEEIATLIKQKIYSPNAPKNLEVIAEPGRYYVSSAFTLATSIHSVKNSSSSSKPTYYISDGIYGALNILKYEPMRMPRLLKKVSNDEETFESLIWGPTCCATDKPYDGLKLPRLDIGDWLVYNDMGAYTTVLGTTFNGFLAPAVVPCVSRDTWEHLKDKLQNGLPVIN